MYIISRRRKGSEEVVPLKDDGFDYYVRVILYKGTGYKTDTVVLIAKEPNEFIPARSIEETVTAGPFPLSQCHKLALAIAQKGRGFSSKRQIMEYNVNHDMNMPHLLSHWVAPIF